jgi:hypothetical protein
MIPQRFHSLADLTPEPKFGRGIGLPRRNGRAVKADIFHHVSRQRICRSRFRAAGAHAAPHREKKDSPGQASGTGKENLKFPNQLQRAGGPRDGALAARSLGSRLTGILPAFESAL